MKSMGSGARAEYWLGVMLRVVGVITGLAVVPVVMPWGWIEAVHAEMGLGAPPRVPVFEYMARTLSALYAIHGGLCWIVARDVRRYAPIITYLIVVGLGFVPLVLAIDVRAGLPASWYLAEGSAILAMTAPMAVLHWRACRARAVGLEFRV